MKTLEKFEIYDGNKQIDKRYKLVRVSRWIEVKENYNPNKRNALWDYVTDGCGYAPYSEHFNPKEGLYLDYFRWNGRNYAIGQFMVFGSIWDNIGHHVGYTENGEDHYITGFDSHELFNPILIEVDEYCQHVRVYEEVAI